MLKNHGLKNAINFGNQAISYQQLFNKIASFSEQFELKAGEHAVVFSENSPAWVTTFYTIWYKKGVAIPIDFMATASEVAYILKDAQPVVVFCSLQGKKLMDQAIYEADINTKMILIDELNQPKAEQDTDLAMPEVNREDTAAIIYTSGTTGSPKGVMISYKNLVQNIDAVSKHIPIYKHESKVLVLLPLHHVFPLVGTMIIPLSLGATIAISPSLKTDDILKTLQDNSITIIIGVPRLYSAIHKGIKTKIEQSAIARFLFKIASKLQSKGFSRKIFKAVHQKFGGKVEFLVSGGAALDPTVGGDFQTLGFDVLEGFGMSEAAPMITFTQPGRVRIGSPGQVVPGTELRIVDGEITSRGNHVMKGYYKRPEETAAVIKDGWLHTGDLGYIDKDGFLFITGRKKEIIILSNGKNVNPSEIENVINESALVKESAVFYENEQLQLLIVTEPDQAADQEPITEQLLKEQVIKPFNEKVSSYKRIHRIHLISEELPRTRLGKLQRFKLPELVHTKAKPTVAPVINDPVFRLVADFVESEKQRSLKPTDHIETDLGFDSLDKISLQTWIDQTFGLKVEPHEIVEFDNVMKMSNWITEHKTKMEDSKINWTEILREKVQLQLPSTWFTGNLAVWASRAFFKLYFRFQTTGLKNLPHGPFILAPNHQSYFDGMFVASLLRYHQVRGTYFYAKEKHVRQSWLKFLANRNNIIVMDMNKDLKASIQKMGEVLRRQKNLIIFPEGTRTINGHLGDFKKTFAILASELKVPVVPVSITGAYEALPRGSFFPKPWKRIKVEFLEPVYPENHSYESLANNVREMILRNQNIQS
ncbi:MAG: AMP-binding protein [Bacteroidetes bacterium]|jgi:long-chain acyl-CoA synthetase|nr:AMP-binding protein [Bacteroidota bacterium]